MSEFKGTQEDWKCVFTSDNRRAVRSKGGIICTLLKPNRYPNQDERYEQELEEVKANQKLISVAPKMLKCIQEFVDAIESEEIIVLENFDNEGYENEGGRLYKSFKQLIQKATE